MDEFVLPHCITFHIQPTLELPPPPCRLNVKMVYISCSLWKRAHFLFSSFCSSAHTQAKHNLKYNIETNTLPRAK